MAVATVTALNASPTINNLLMVLSSVTGVKDTGGLIPGHGGILDRVDSLTYAAATFVHFIRYFFYP